MNTNKRSKDNSHLQRSTSESEDFYGWKSVDKELPLDGEEVLVAQRGSIKRKGFTKRIAVFSTRYNSFGASVGELKFVYYWCRIPSLPLEADKIE